MTLNRAAMRTLKEKLCLVKLQGVAENLLNLHNYGNSAKAASKHHLLRRNTSTYLMSKKYAHFTRSQAGIFGKE